MGQGNWQVVKKMTRSQLRKYLMNGLPNAARVRLRLEDESVTLMFSVGCLLVALAFWRPGFKTWHRHGLVM